MIANCRISDNTYHKGKYCVIIPMRGERSRILPYDDFEQAYLAACEFVGWKLSNITIEVYPQFVRDVMKRVTHECVKLKIENERRKEKEEYLRLKQKFDPDPPEVITENSLDSPRNI